jgi:hypothetical protein
MTGEHTYRAAERPLSWVSSQIWARGLTDEPREPGGQRTPAKAVAVDGRPYRETHASGSFPTTHEKGRAP